MSEPRNRRLPARRLASCLALVALVGCSSAALTAPHRLADGTPVPRDAAFEPPEPLDPITAPMIASIGTGGMKGRFRADVVVSETGEVVDVRVTSSIHELLDREYDALLRQMRFRPATLDGAPVAAIHPVRIDLT